MTPGRGRRRGQERPACSAAAAPASRPASKWGFLPAGRVAALPRRQRRRERARHLQGPPPHGARPAPAHRGHASSPATPSGCRRPSSTSAARWRSPRSASPPALNEAYAAGYVGKNILGSDFSRRHRPALGRRRLHRRRGDGAASRASRATAACRASSRRTSRRPRASTCSRRSSTTSRRCPTCRGSSSTAARRSPRSAPRRRTGTRMFAVSGHVKQPGRVRGRVRRHHVPRPDLRARATAAASATARELKAFIPGGASAPWFFAEHLDLPLEQADGRQGRLDARLGRDRRDGRDHRHGQGLPGASCASSPASRAASARRAARAPRWLERILERIIDGHGRPERPRPAARRRRQHQPRASRGRPQQTTICPLGPSAVTPDRLGASMRFRDEFEALHRRPGRVAVDVHGAASSAPSATARVTPPSRRTDDRVAVTINGATVEARKGELRHRRRRARTASTSRGSATTRA